MSTNKARQHAEQLYRIHSYSQILADLCSEGQQAIDVTKLEQVFTDIAKVTEQAYVSMDELIAEQRQVEGYLDPYDILAK